MERIISSNRPIHSIKKSCFTVFCSFPSESFPYMRNQHQNWYNNADCRPYFDYQFKFSVKVVRQGSNIIKGNQQIKDKIYWKEFVYPLWGFPIYHFFDRAFSISIIFIFVSFTRLITDPDTKRTDNAEKCKT